MKTSVLNIPVCVPRKVMILSFLVVLMGFQGWAQYEEDWHKEKKEVNISPMTPINWVDAGAGILGEQFGYQASANFQIKDRFVTSLGYDQILNLGTSSSDPSVEAKSMSFELGYLLRGNRFSTHLTVGPSYSWGQFLDKNDITHSETYDVWGMKFKAGAFSSLYPLGISGFVHFNSRNTYAGITLNGILRWKKR